MARGGCYVCARAWRRIPLIKNRRGNMLKDLVLKNRSYRRFDESRRISAEELMELAELGHYTPSAKNKQPVRFVLVSSEESCGKVFETVGWAGYLEDWDGPKAGERPSGYIILLSPEGTNCQWDEAIIGQTILLGAVEKGMGGCFIGCIDRQKLADNIDIPDEYKAGLIIALGYPVENVVIKDIGLSDDIKYYRDEEQNHYVPKYVMDDVIISSI